MKNSAKKLYFVWRSMKHRCRCKTYKEYANYGGRGIAVCEAWLNDYSAFERWALANGYKEGKVLDRKYNDKGYSPDNCRWISPDVSLVNKQNKGYTAFGVTKSLTAWAADPRCIHVGYQGLVTRIKKGMSLEQALLTPRQRNYW